MSTLTLADQLKKHGLISNDSFEQHRKTEKNHLQANKGKQRSKFKGTKGIITFGEEELNTAKTIKEFKHVAKNMLENDPQAITEILKSAHNFKKRTGDKKIVWFFYQVRDALKKYPANRIDELIKRMFRKNNPKFELPED